MRRLMLVACLTLMTVPGCVISRTKEKEVSRPSVRASQTCGSEVCDADEDCVRSSGGTLHCE